MNCNGSMRNYFPTQNSANTAFPNNMTNPVNTAFPGNTAGPPNMTFPANTAFPNNMTGPVNTAANTNINPPMPATGTVNTQQMPQGPTMQFGNWSNTFPVDPNMPTSPASVMMPLPTDAPETLTQPIYTPGYLRMNIGALMRVEFLIGTNTTDRTGILRDVGASFIVLDALDGGSKMMCDIYSIKFVTILQAVPDRSLFGGVTIGQ